MISFGVPAGATRPYQVVASNPVSPSSSMVATPGSSPLCVRVASPSARSRPCRTWLATSAAGANIIWTWPAMTSCRAGAGFLYGTWTRFDLGLGLEQFAGEMRGAAVTRRREGDGAGLGPGDLDQMRQRLRGKGGIDHQRVGLRPDQRDRREIELRIEPDVLPARRIGREDAGVAHQQRIAVMRGVGGVLAGDVAAGAGTILHHQRLPQHRCQQPAQRCGRSRRSARPACGQRSA